MRRQLKEIDIMNMGKLDLTHINSMQSTNE